jgi:hypothetical protein
MLALSPKYVFLFLDDAMAPGFAQAAARPHQTTLVSANGS